MDDTAGLPKVQGIQLIGTHQLPDRVRSIFPFPNFNAVQSKCFDAIYRRDANFVLSSPTGSGKTAIFELAICRLWTTQPAGTSFKVIYQAPTKSLCGERTRDWQRKFSHLGLKCAELTGDTEQAHLRSAQTADILITTPEKWDTMTRKWRDHRKLMQLVRLFLIDEVHILKDNRGASLEAVVSRMKLLGTDVRFIALSATVPNPGDLATWLGQSQRLPGLPAEMEVFGENFRPVKLHKLVIGLQGANANDFAFEGLCDVKLPEIVSKHSAGKPIMIFCMTRKFAEKTAELLAGWWQRSDSTHQFWSAPSSVAGYNIQDPTLRSCISAGVAFHHAGLKIAEKTAVEKGYLNGDIGVICCTSTLAAGVNLPCHLVIIKNTVGYSDSGCKEYSDLDVIQMLGRAGRPQFDTSAVAVIMTRQEKVEYYDKMVSGQEILESRLHVSLIEHLNAEIAMGTIKDLETAVSWLKGTFLATRLRQNSRHYKLLGDQANKSVEEIFSSICAKDIGLLQEYRLATEQDLFRSTELGDAMSRYYVQFETMKLMACLRKESRNSEIISALAQASEFKAIRFRFSEKQILKDINTSPSIKFPIPVDIALSPHKISLLLQATLGGLDIDRDDHFGGHKQLVIDVNIILQHAPRLVRCVIDCAIYRNDSITARNALELLRSLGARIWDDSPFQLMQVDKVGPVLARKLIAANINSIEDLEFTDAQKIDMIATKNPPFGANMLRSLKSYPKLRVSLRKIGSVSSRINEGGQYVAIEMKAEIGFLNDTPPTHWKGSFITVILLAETSDGRVAHFSRLTAQKIGLGENVMFTALLAGPQNMVTCYVACEEIAGTLRSATLDPKIPSTAFAALAKRVVSDTAEGAENQSLGTTRRRIEDCSDDEIDDSDLMNAGHPGFDDISDLHAVPARTEVNTGKKRKAAQEAQISQSSIWDTQRLPNGNWACQHSCKDKTACKHLCCREGTEKKPRQQKKNKVEPDSKAKESTAISPINEYFTQAQRPEPSGNPGPRSQERASRVHGYGGWKSVNQTDSARASNHPPCSLAPPNMSKTVSNGMFVSSSPSKRHIEAVDLRGETFDAKAAALDQDASGQWPQAVFDSDFGEEDLLLNEDFRPLPDSDAYKPSWSPDGDDGAALGRTYNPASAEKGPCPDEASETATPVKSDYTPPRNPTTLAELKNFSHRPAPILTSHKVPDLSSGPKRALSSFADCHLSYDDDTLTVSGQTPTFEAPTPSESKLQTKSKAVPPSVRVDADVEDWFKAEFGDCAEIAD